MKKLVIKKCETDFQLLLIDMRQTLGRYLYLGESLAEKICRAWVFNIFADLNRTNCLIKKSF